jgi:hypothetical protein
LVPTIHLPTHPLGFIFVKNPHKPTFVKNYDVSDTQADAFLTGGGFYGGGLHRLEMNLSKPTNILYLSS